MMNKFINRRNINILLLFVICLGFFSIKSTYAKFIQGYTTPDDVVNYNYDFRFAIKSYSEEESSSESFSMIEEYEIVSVNAHSYDVFNIDISNVTSFNVYYGVWYKKLNDVDDSKFNVFKLASSSYDVSGELGVNETKTTTVVVRNDSDNNLELKIGVASNENSVSDIGYYDDRKPISEVGDNYSYGDANEPILGPGMIPVSYDEKGKRWVKADSSNKNNGWYDYNNKRWANIVLVRDNVRDSYISALPGTSIDSSSILAFYVWIPRFKYKVWDINRQISSEKNYSYNAMENGIQIVFESDSYSTGNVSCIYNVKNTFDNDYLSDVCSYANNDVVLSNSNSVYSDAWYTHPAFLGNLSGFWIGKYETGGVKTEPTIVGGNSLVSLDLSSMFSVSRLFNNYGIRRGMEARIIKNLEWGAVSYLSHSIYGLCENSICGKVSDSVSTSGNITGVYDMASGSLEFVMGNVVNTSFGFNNSSALNNWNENLDISYYDVYSNVVDSANRNSYYKTRLGDATSEVTINGVSWGNTIVSLVANGNYPWIIRGFGNNIYGYAYSDGSANDKYTFRSVIS